MTQAVGAFLEACYVARQPTILERDVQHLEAAVKAFHVLRHAFDDVRGSEGYSLPRQHSLVHYGHLIRQFGAPTGLCSSITESKHIDAVKKPYRRSNRHEALGQMLVTNQRMEKLAAARQDFAARGMLGSLNANVELAPIPKGLEYVMRGGLRDKGPDGQVEDKLMAEVFLAKRKSLYSSMFLTYWY